MFRWYQDAQVCYAYLSDVPEGDGDHSAPRSAFRRSKWFSRGRTLQELLVLSMVVFYNRDWIDISTKSSLYDVITSITVVKPFGQLRGCFGRSGNAVGVKKGNNWSRGHGLLSDGHFLCKYAATYGEGGNAFMRLQLEILSKSDDQSIFAWKASLDYSLVPMSSFRWDTGGLLAHFPTAFIKLGDIRKATALTEEPPFSMINKRLCIELFFASLSNVHRGGQRVQPAVRIAGPP
jgi:hypothetical protein